MPTTETLWPRQVLEVFHNDVQHLRSKTDAGVHMLPAGTALGVEPVRHILFGSADSTVNRLTVTEIAEVLGRARMMAIDLEHEAGLLAARAVLMTGPGEDSTWVSLRLRVASDGSWDELRTRIGAPELDRGVVDKGWGASALGGAAELNSEVGVRPGERLHIPLRLTVAFSGLLRELHKSYRRVPIPAQTRREPRSVVSRPISVSQ